jgi:sigma-B regulation protein RsbU (phosphoserine phosphatase)
MPENQGVNRLNVKIENLEAQVRTMGTCIEVAAIITSTLDSDKLISLVMEKSKEVMNAEACSILLYNKQTNKLEFRLALHENTKKAEVLKDVIELDMGQGIAGWVAENLQPVLVEDAQADQRFFKSADEVTSFVTKSLIAVPMVGRRGLIGVAEIMNPKHKEYFDQLDLDVFQTHIRQVAIAMENAQYHEESLKQERIRHELEIASSLQQSFLPDSPVFEKGNIRLSAVSQPASNIGGDFYDFIEPPGDRVGVAIGDISGKGISGALFMAKAMSDFRYIARTAVSTKEALEDLNSILSKTPRGMFLTATYIIAETQTGNLHISVAGHPPAIWLTSEGVKFLEAPAGPPLGIMETEYPTSTVTMSKGDRLILLTDGVFEARDREGNMMGFNGVVEFLKQNSDKSDVLHALLDHVKDFANGAEPHDDITIVEVAYGAKR